MDGRAEESRIRQDEEKAADNLARQLRLGHIEEPPKKPKAKAKPKEESKESEA